MIIRVTYHLGLEHGIEAVALIDEGDDLNSVNQEVFEKMALQFNGKIKTKPYQVNSMYQAVAIVQVGYRVVWENACLHPFWGTSTNFYWASYERKLAFGSNS